MICSYEVNSKVTYKIYNIHEVALMKGKLKIVTLCVLFVAVVVMWLPNYKLTEKKVSAQDNTAKSTIAGIVVTDLEGDDLTKKVQTAVSEWSSSPVVLSGGGNQVVIDAALFTFDVQGTIATYEQQVEKPWYAFWEKTRTVQLPLIVTADPQVKTMIDNILLWKADETYQHVLSQVAYLKGHEMQATVTDLSVFETERIALSLEPIPETATGVKELATMLDDFMISPGQTVSLLQIFGSLTESANQQALDFVSSVVYHTVLQTNSEILQRHSQKKIPDYLEAGIEATINQSKQQDLQFVSRANEPLKYKVTFEKNNLKLELTAQVAVASAQPRVEVDKIVKPKLITRYSKELAINKQKVVQQGKEGLRVIVYRFMNDGSGKDEIVSRDYYPAINRIIMKSALAPAEEGAVTGEDTIIDLNGDGIADDPATIDEQVEDVTEENTFDKGGNEVTE